MAREINPPRKLYVGTFEFPFHFALPDDANLEGRRLGAQDSGKAHEGGRPRGRSGDFEKGPAVRALQSLPAGHRGGLRYPQHAFRMLTVGLSG